jgi:thioredoxin 1
MKLAYIFLLTTIPVIVTLADTIQLNTGKSVSGSVVSYANMTFEVQYAKSNDISRLSSAFVRSIEFGTNGVAAHLETRTRGKRNGTVTRYEKSIFLFQPETGPAEKIQAMVVLNLSLGGGSAKDVDVISHGQRIDIAKHLAPGKITIVYFYAVWCGPCRNVAPKLTKLAQDDPDVVLRKVNIVNWGSAVAEQFSLKRIPHINVYDDTGKLIYNDGFSLEAVTAAIKKAKVPGK